MCQSNLHQMVMILKTYCNNHDNQFPNPTYIYHSKESFMNFEPGEVPPQGYGDFYPWHCRWHDARIGPASPLLREHKELQGELLPYVGNAKVLLCKTAVRTYLERGCNNSDPNKLRRPQPMHHGGGGGGPIGPIRPPVVLGIPEPNDPLRIIPQYAYTMNGYLYRTVSTGGLPTGSVGGAVDPRAFRTRTIRREAQVTRSPAEVFAFGEENSWPINRDSRWPSPYNLSGPWGGTQDGVMSTDPKEKKLPTFRVTGAITIGSLNIGTSFTTFDSSADRPYASRMPQTDVGDAFATFHRPRRGDLNTGHSYVAMLDGHVQKVTISDQLRRSRQDPNFAPSRFGPGGNLSLAWPLDIPPLGGWENR